MIPNLKSPTISHTIGLESAENLKRKGVDSVLCLKTRKDVEERSINPVAETSEYAHQKTALVQVDSAGLKVAARLLYEHMRRECYQPRTWRTMPLHICPPEPYDPANPLTKTFLDWIFLISSLNFSFWSEYEREEDRFGVEWRAGWGREEREVWTGYWCLVAALNKALEEGIPITDPAFYSCEEKCPDSLIRNIFRPSSNAKEPLPLIEERIRIMRENGGILCSKFGGSFQNFHETFQEAHNGQGTALDLVKMVTETFPTFQDEVWYEGRKVCVWKRAQILVAESWAAFYPPGSSQAHPLFPGVQGPQIDRLTMFADYRVPQILHHLRILYYPPALLNMLEKKTILESGSREELSIRTASVIAVERVREEIVRLMEEDEKEYGMERLEVNSVLLDFYLWEMAKKVESGEEKVEEVDVRRFIPAHRTRSIWY